MTKVYLAAELSAAVLLLVGLFGSIANVVPHPVGSVMVLPALILLALRRGRHG